MTVTPSGSNHLPVVFAFYSATSLADRRKEAEIMRDRCMQQRLPYPLEICDDIYDALQHVLLRRINQRLSLAKREASVIIIGEESAIRPLRGQEEDPEGVWKRALLLFLREHRIFLLPVQGEVVHRKGEEFPLFERTYLRLKEHLLAKARQAQQVKPGIRNVRRPPYGYTGVCGRLILDHDKVPVIKYVIQQIRQGRTPTSVAHGLRDDQTLWQALYPGGVPEHIQKGWDCSKVLRLCGNVRLYCLGEFVPKDEAPVIIPELAFLPPEWARSSAFNRPDYRQLSLFPELVSADLSALGNGAFLPDPGCPL